MAPLRRYLRITKYSVLECRIYLDNPALAHSWLLNPRDPILPRVIDSVRPLVLPKLREERERSRKKSTKKRGIKDTVTEDDFEVSIFLTETTTRHSLLYKHKHFRDTTQTKLTSNSSKLTGASREAPVDVDDEVADVPTMIREEPDDDDVIALHDIPTLGEDETAGAGAPARLSKRRRGANTAPIVGDDDELGTAESPLVSDEEDGDLFVSAHDNEDEDTGRRPAKRRKDEASAPEYETGRDDKKKLGIDISYEGFAIYGRVLCLVVKRRGDGDSNKGKGVAVPSGARGSRPGHSAAQAGSAMMENWITSTQMPEAVRNEVLDAT